MMPKTIAPKHDQLATPETSTAPKGKKFKALYDQKKVVRDKEKEEPSACITPLALMSSSGVNSAAPAVSIPPVQEIKAIFLSMVEKMYTLHKEGLTTTTFILNPKHDSILSGTEITILEYNTAPKDFNIQIKGSPQAVQLLDQHLGELVSAFNAEYRPFKINRLEVYHQTKKSVRKSESKSPKEELMQDDGSALSLD